MPPAWTAIWLTQADLENAISQSTVSACFDDGNSGINITAVAAVIKRAEMKVLSYLGDYGPPPFSPAVLAQLGADNFLADRALDYAIAFAFDRHPEYVRANGKERFERFAAADAEMRRVLDAVQRPPQTAVPAGNVGGAAQCGGPTIYICNEGDY